MNTKIFHIEEGFNTDAGYGSIAICYGVSYAWKATDTLNYVIDPNVDVEAGVTDTDHAPACIVNAAQGVATFGEMPEDVLTRVYSLLALLAASSLPRPTNVYVPTAYIGDIESRTGSDSFSNCFEPESIKYYSPALQQNIRLRRLRPEQLVPHLDWLLRWSGNLAPYAHLFVAKYGKKSNPIEEPSMSRTVKSLSHYVQPANNDRVLVGLKVIREDDSRQDYPLLFCTPKVLSKPISGAVYLDMLPNATRLPSQGEYQWVSLMLLALAASAYPHARWFISVGALHTLRTVHKFDCGSWLVEGDNHPQYREFDIAKIARWANSFVEASHEVMSGSIATAVDALLRHVTQEAHVQRTKEVIEQMVTDEPVVHARSHADVGLGPVQAVKFSSVASPKGGAIHDVLKPLLDKVWEQAGKAAEEILSMYNVRAERAVELAEEMVKIRQTLDHFTPASDYPNMHLELNDRLTALSTESQRIQEWIDRVSSADLTYVLTYDGAPLFRNPLLDTIRAMGLSEATQDEAQDGTSYTETVSPAEAAGKLRKTRSDESKPRERKVVKKVIRKAPAKTAGRKVVKKVVKRSTK